MAQLEAPLQGDQAAIDNARVQLGYTTITAPLTGRTGIRLVDQGNIVHASDTTGLVVITQLEPISRGLHPARRTIFRRSARRMAKGTLDGRRPSPATTRPRSARARWR